jgi:hypothetical protein
MQQTMFKLSNSYNSWAQAASFGTYCMSCVAAIKHSVALFKFMCMGLGGIKNMPSASIQSFSWNYNIPLGGFRAPLFIEPATLKDTGSARYFSFPKWTIRGGSIEEDLYLRYRSSIVDVDISIFRNYSTMQQTQ